LALWERRAAGLLCLKRWLRLEAREDLGRKISDGHVRNALIPRAARVD